MSDNFFEKYFADIAAITSDISSDVLVQVANEISACKGRGGKTIVVGNGGSAAISSHVAVDLTKAAKTRAINFNESDLITCFANDYGYENWVAEAIKAYGDTGDVLILISSSGSSKNIVNAAKQGREMGLKVVTLSGFASDNNLRGSGDINLWANSKSYNYVEMVHQGWLLAIVDYLIDVDEG